MKTKNQFQTAVQKTLAVVVTFVLLGLTVSAQDFWKDFFSKSQHQEIILALADVSEELETDDSSDYLSTFRILSLIETEKEHELELEDWMVNEYNFHKTFFNMEDAIESQLNLENWMFNENLFKVRNIYSRKMYETEEEQSIKLENWMLSEQCWK